MDMIMNAMSMSISKCCMLSKFGRKKIDFMPPPFSSFEHHRIFHPVKASHGLKQVVFSSYLYTHVNTKQRFGTATFQDSMVGDPLSTIFLIMRVIVASNIVQKEISMGKNIIRR